MCVLRWIASTKTQPVLVANRLREIKACPDIKFCYIPTQENPADLASRGVTLDSISTSTLWWHGPSWLIAPNSNWLVTPPLDWDMDCGTPSTESSLPAMDMCHRPSVSQPDAVPPFGIDIGTFSSVSRLVRVTAWCSRFLTNCRVKSSVPRYGPLTIAELQSSLYRWIAHVQSCTRSWLFYNEDR